MVFDMDGGDARSRLYAGTPDVLVKKCKVIAGRPRMIQILPQSVFAWVSDRDRRVAHSRQNADHPLPSLSKTYAK